MRTTTFQFKDYPVCIEPTTQVIECRFGGDNPKWVPLHRVSTARVQLAMSQPTRVVHFFGDHVQFTQCRVVVGYDVGGMITTYALKVVDAATASLQQWDVQTLPEEVTGSAIQQPSVRLVFDTEESREAFLVGYMPDGLTEDPRLVDVWTDHSDG